MRNVEVYGVQAPPGWRVGLGACSPLLAQVEEGARRGWVPVVEDGRPSWKTGTGLRKTNVGQAVADARRKMRRQLEIAMTHETTVDDG